MKKTLIIGASENEDRYSNKAIHTLRRYGYEVVAIGSKTGKVLDVAITTKKEKFTDIDTISIYLSPHNQTDYYLYIQELQPQRVIFNPGTENPELALQLSQAKIDTENACTLVLLNTRQF